MKCLKCSESDYATIQVGKCLKCGDIIFTHEQSLKLDEVRRADEKASVLRMVEHDLKLMMAYINTQEPWTPLEQERYTRIKSFAEMAVNRIQQLSA